MNYIKTKLSEFVKENHNKEDNDLVLYRGVTSTMFKPDTQDGYTFFAKSKNFASDYGEYVYKCIFKPLNNLFISYEEKFVKELYDNGFKLRDEYIEFNWDNKSSLYDNISDLYDYDPDIRDDSNFGYKSYKHFMDSPFSGSDTWEVIEHTEGVVSYIFSKYDGIVLLEGGETTYLLDTSDIITCELID